MRIKLDLAIDLAFIKEALSKRADDADGKIMISHISTDTRELCRGDLFIALAGEKYDGECFLKDAKKLGAICIGRDTAYSDITVEDTTTALQSLAGAYLDAIAPRSIVAITGSCGKTTTKNLTADILRQKFRIHATKGNLNNQFGVAFTVLSMPRDTEVLIVECGMNHPGELFSISKFIRQTLSVITNIGSAHIGNFKSREKIAEAKKELLTFARNPVCLVPHNEPLLEDIELPLTVGYCDQDATFYLNVINENENTTCFEISTPQFSINRISCTLQKPHVLRCLPYAVATAALLGLCESEVIEGIKNSNTLNENVIKNVGGLRIIDDSYNSSPEAAELAVAYLKKYESNCSAVIGDMLELGDAAAAYHFRLGEKCAEARIRRLFLIGDNRDHVRAGAICGGMSEKSISLFKKDVSAEKIARLLIEECSDDVILIKGSHKLALGKIPEAIKKLKGDK